jgi:hypothetical protein
MTTSDEQVSPAAEEAERDQRPRTDAPAALVVTLADLDQVGQESVAGAIRALDGVVSVRPIDTETSEQLLRERVDAEWRQRIIGLLDDEGV